MKYFIKTNEVLHKSDPTSLKNMLIRQSDYMTFRYPSSEMCVNQDTNVIQNFLYTKNSVPFKAILHNVGDPKKTSTTRAVDTWIRARQRFIDVKQPGITTF